MHCCNDAGQGKPGCLIVADDLYTMDFTDVEPGGVIYWCSVCGPAAHAMQETLTNALAADPVLRETLQWKLDVIEALERIEQARKN